jgi:hypothetical protein
MEDAAQTNVVRRQALVAGMHGRQRGAPASMVPVRCTTRPVACPLHTSPQGRAPGWSRGKGRGKAGGRGGKAGFYSGGAEQEEGAPGGRFSSFAPSKS